MNILVTGSAGFICGYLVEELLLHGHTVYGIDNFSKYGKVQKSYDNHPNYHFIEGDVKNTPLMKELALQCDQIISAAAMIGGISYFHELAYDLLAENERIIASTFDAAIHAFRHGHLEKINILSSSMVFECTETFPSREGDERKSPPPMSTYGFQKLACEYFAQGAWEQYKLPYTIIRPFNCVGIGEKRALCDKEIASGNVKLAMSHVVPDLVQKILKGQDPLHILGSGQQIRHYTYGGDLARGIRLCAENPNARNEDFNLSSVVSWQFLADDMLIDQDFTPASMFSLNQTQREHAVTCEFILKPEDTWRTGWWNWQTGISGFWRRNRMSAPVTFLEDGIVSLIEDNVNGIFQNLPLPVSLQFDIAEDSFDIGSDFLLGSWNAAAYHESWFNVGKWLFSVGARLDYERYSMDYDSAASVHYSVSPIPALDKRPFSVEYAGSVSEGCLEFIPKVSVLYDFGEEGSREGIRVYMTASKGYRAGGFNTQIFSDILQNMMMDGMMADAMGQMMQSGGGSGQSGTPSVTAEDTAYRPERSFNYEAGCNFNLVLGKSGGHRLGGSASVFYIDCRDQQMTCFPPGEGTGRMMANIGRSRSAGAELTLDYEWKGFSASASCGYADARFVRYNDGTADWSGNRIPYSPESTLFVRASYDFGFGRGIVRGLAVAADVSGTGRIWWNEANTLHSPFRAVAGADVSVRMKLFEIRFRADNLSGEEYPVFYFRSVGNDFFQMSRPFRWSVALRFEL